LLDELVRENDTNPFRCEANFTFGERDDLPSTPFAAQKIFNDTRKKDELYNFSNRDGEFFLQKPEEVHALIHGTYLRRPCTYYITKFDYEWYIKAAEITIEMIDYVLAQKDPENYYLQWSG
jgi:hypothetical protein